MRPPVDKHRYRHGLGSWILALAAISCAPRFIYMDALPTYNEVVRPPVHVDAPPDNPPREIPSNLIYSPTPDPYLIARAWPRRVDELETKIEYCVNTEGKTEALEIVETSGFKAIDRACVQVLRKWRAKPHVLQGKAVRSCDSVTFQIRAIRPRARD